MKVLTRIAQCADGHERAVDPKRRSAVVVHRTGMGSTAEEVSKGFQRAGPAGDATGHHMPYTIVIGKHGQVEQALHISDYGPHALAWSMPGIGVAVVGDPRVEPLPRLQYEALIEVCSTLAGWLGGASVVWGHDELRDATRDPLRECPGRYLDMGQVRRDVQEAARLACEDAGFIF